MWNEIHPLILVVTTVSPRIISSFKLCWVSLILYVTGPSLIRRYSSLECHFLHNSRPHAHPSVVFGLKGLSAFLQVVCRSRRRICNSLAEQPNDKLILIAILPT
jgi:hypothetical protein